MKTASKIAETKSSAQRNAILHEIAVGTANFGIPVLLEEKNWELAEQMADAGELERHEPIFGSCGYTLSDTGKILYNAAFPPKPLPAPVKAWGDRPPKTLNARINFIKRQCPDPLEDAWWLEIEGEDGHTESWTLAESELDKKLVELGYDFRNRENNDGHIAFGSCCNSEREESLPTCEITGKLLSGSLYREPRCMAYGLEGFSWRRSEKFQMEKRDWYEALGYIERLDTGYRAQAKLRRLIVDSCFLEPASLNDTGLICPGGGGADSFEDLIDLFDFMQTEPLN